MMDTEANQPPLIVFDDEVNEESKTLSSGQNEQDSSPNSASLSEERVGRASVPVSDGSGSQGYLDMNSTGQGESSGSERKAEQGKDLDANGMEDMIQKILEKYGEAEDQAGGSVTPGRTRTTQDATERKGAAKREAETSVNDMIQRESPKWNRVYGTEENHASGSTRDRTCRQEIGRRSVTATEDTYNDYVEIGSVIRSQTGVARQLTSVCDGLDGVNDDLEEMKMELKRIQTKAYTCLEGGDLLGGQTAKELAPIGGLNDADIYRRRNEWIEEREGTVRFDDGNSGQETERCWKKHQAPASYLPFAGRSHIKESDVNLAHLLTIAEPVERYRETRSLDRFGRPTTQSISVEDSSSKHNDDRWSVKGSRGKPDGYCVMCEEFGDINTTRKSMSAYDEPSKVVHRSHNHTYNSTPAYDEDTNLVQKSHNRTYRSMSTYDEPSKVSQSSYNHAYNSTPAYDEATNLVQRSHNRTYRSMSTFDEPSKAAQRSYNHTYNSIPTYEEPSKVAQRSYNHTYNSMPTTYEEPSKVAQRSYNHTYNSIPTYDEPSKVVYRSRNHTYSSSSVADLDQNSLHRSREDLGGIYKTPSGIYFYSDDIRSYSDEATLDPTGTARSYIRQSSVPRGFQSESQSVAVQRPRSLSQRSSSGFTSRFLTKVRRRNSLGGRIDTDRYSAQTLKGY